MALIKRTPIDFFSCLLQGSDSTANNSQLEMKGPFEWWGSSVMGIGTFGLQLKVSGIHKGLWMLESRISIRISSLRLKVKIWFKFFKTAKLLYCVKVWTIVNYGNWALNKAIPMIKSSSGEAVTQPFGCQVNSPIRKRMIFPWRGLLGCCPLIWIEEF